MNFKKKAIYNAVLLSLPLLFSQSVVAGNFTDLISAGGGSKNHVEFAQYLESVAATSPELTDLLNTATSEEAALKLISDIVPDAEGAALDAAIVSVELMQRAIAQRSSNIRQQSAAGKYNFGWNTWVSPLLSDASKDDSEGVNGFDGTTYGIMVGADTFVIEDETFIGYSLAYTNTDSTVNNSTKEVTSSNGEFLMYAGWIQEAFFIDAAFNIGRSSVDSERTIGAGSGYSGDTSATATYNQYQIGYAGKVGATYDLGFLTAEPSVGYSRQWLYQEDYQEQGSIASLRYDRETYDLQYVTTGLDLYTEINSSWGVITPKLTLSYAADLYPNERVKETVQLAIDDPKDKDSFSTILGAKVGGDKLNATLGASLAFNKSASLNTAVSYTSRDDYSAIGGSVNFVQRF